MADEPQVIERPDPFVRRFNDVTTTLMDVIGAVLFAAGAGLGVARWDMAGEPLGLVVAGLVLTLLSGLAQRRQQPARPAKVPPGAHPHLKPLPGPEDPGNLHIAGR